MRFARSMMAALMLMSFGAQSSLAADPLPISSPSPTETRIVIPPRDPKTVILHTLAAPKFGLTAKGIHVMADQVKAGEVCQKDLTATKETLTKCRATQVPPQSFFQKPAVIVMIAVFAVVAGFGVAKLTQGSPSSSAAQPAATPAALVRF